MMIKVFTTNKNGEITLTAKELKELLDEAYWEGYRNNNHTWTYSTPLWSPYYCTTADNSITLCSNKEAKTSADSLTIKASDITTNTISSNLENKIRY